MTVPRVSISEQAQQLTAQTGAQLPPDIVRVFAADQAARISDGVPAGVATPGTALPTVALLDMAGQWTTLDAVRAGRPAVVVLYRGGWCPYCNLTLRTYQRDLAQVLADRGVALIAISPETPDHTEDTVQRNQLTFAVLTDQGNTVATALGVVIEQPAPVVQAQARLGLDLAQHNAGGARTLPMPTVVVTDADGVIRWIDVHPDYTTRTEVAEILSAVEPIVQQ